MRLIVEPNWVKDNLEQLVIIDCRFDLNAPHKGRESYLSEHLPNAYYFDLVHDLSGEKQKHGGRHPLPDTQLLKEKLEMAGVTDDITVVLYDDQNSSMASRLWWLLNYYGHKNSYVLNGGFQEWKRLGYPLESTVPPSGKKGAFTLKLQKDMVVSAPYIIDKMQSFEQRDSYLIDSREEKRYKGIEEPIDNKAGHIPGALHYFWMENINDSGRWKNQQELADRFAELDKNKEVIVYCGSGVTACPNILALKEAGFSNVKLYSGSWSDWISCDENPIESCENR
ncbi:sulfurtransferase [Sutcliffiella deserti]|uniref:sulfurtransferase n=1 Tax=Sutcliffiella deserti TaxID=2875501 RepID=UPI001CBFE941|nr:sulfurtransferase [Sutcliffiella deserti]